MMLVLLQEHIDEVIVELKSLDFDPQIRLDILIDLWAANQIPENVLPLNEGIRGSLGLEVFLETEMQEGEELAGLHHKGQRLLNRCEVLKVLHLKLFAH